MEFFRIPPFFFDPDDDEPAHLQLGYKSDSKPAVRSDAELRFARRSPDELEKIRRNYDLCEFLHGKTVEFSLSNGKNVYLNAGGWM